jgi:fructose-bisphosphate aldolase class 1
MVFSQLYIQRVVLEGLILKPNMVLPGLNCPKQEAVDEVGDATVRCLLRTVPAAVPGITFLSGGQSGELATARLNAMNVRFKSQLPWEFGMVRRVTYWQHSKLCIIGPSATGTLAVANTVPRWKKI